jgi:hypothetical protein
MSPERANIFNVIRGNPLDPDPEPDLDSFSAGLLGVELRRTESTLVEVRPLHAAEEQPVEMALGWLRA